MKKLLSKLPLLLLLFSFRNLPAQVLFSEDFNQNILPSGWAVEDSGTGPARWMVHPSTVAIPMNGSNYLFVNSDSGGTASSTANESITSPVIASGSGQALFLSFSHFFRKRNNRQDTGRVEIFHNGIWNEVLKVSANTGQAGVPANEKIDISSYAGPDMRIRFRYTSLRAWYWAIDNLKIFSPFPADIGVSRFQLGSGNCGLSLPFNPVVWLKNYGSMMQTGFSVHYQVTGQTAVSQVFSDSLYPGDSIQFSFSNAVISAPSNPFEITAWTSLSADSDAANDSANTLINLVPSAFSLVEFTDYDGTNLSAVHPGWDEASGLNPQSGASAWNVSTAAEVTGLGSVTARINLYTTGKREWIVSPVFSPNPATSLQYKVAVTDWTLPDSDQMGSDDSMIVKVSTDCGQSWQSLAWYTAADGLPNQLTEKSLSLAAYAGQPIQIAFYAAEGNTDDANDYDFHIDQIELGVLSSNDLRLAEIQLPGGNCGAPASFPIRVKLKNNGSLTQTSAPMTYRVAGESPVSQTFSVSLLPGADTTLEFTQLVSIAAGGNYSISAWVTLPLDSNAQNDSVLAIPFTRPFVTFTAQGFTGYNGDNLTDGWQEFTGLSPVTAGSAWSAPATVQITSLGSETARINLYSSFKTEWIVSPAFNPASNKTLKFKVAVTDWTTGDPDQMGSDDSLIVKITTNCGESWQDLKTFTQADNLTNSLTEFTIPLSTYINQTLRIAFYASEGSTDDANDYDLHIDDIQLINLSPTDVGLTALILPSAECGLPSSLPVKVTMKNFGTQAQSGISLGYSVNGGAPFTATYSSSLAPGENVVYEFSQPADISQPGNYIIRAWASVNGDQDNGNDTLASEPLSPTPAALPPVDFSSFDGSNLSQLFPGWVEKSGHEPSGTTSFWNVGTASQTSGLGSTAARVGIVSNTRREWLISPGFRPAPQTELRFKLALTSINFAVPGTLGSDDSLKVLISTNCGLSWELVTAFTSASGLTNTLVPKTADLSAWAGQSCLIGFKATSGNVANTQSTDIHLDDIETGPLTTGASQLISGKASIRLFPNPAAGKTLFVEGDDANGNLRFFSSTGKEVFPEPAQGNGRSFDLKEITSGMYYIRTESGNTAGFVIP
jgi:hypothetical protein